MSRYATDFVSLGNRDKRGNFIQFDEKNPLVVKVVGGADTSSVDMVELKKQLKEEITSSLPATVSESTIDSKIQEAIKNALKTLPANPGTNTPTVDLESLKSQILASITVPSKDEIKNELKSELTNSIKTEVQSGIVVPSKDEIKNELKAEIKNEVSSTIPSKDEIKQEVKTELSSSFPDKEALKTEITESVKSFVTNKDEIKSEIKEEIKNESFEVTNKIVRDIPTGGGKDSVLSSGGFAVPNNSYVGKVVTEVGFDKAADGIMHIMRLKQSGETHVVVKEVTVNFSGTGHEWFPVDLGSEPFANDEYIGVVKPNVTTAKFKYGSPGEGFKTIIGVDGFLNNAKSIIAGTETLSVGFKVKDIIYHNIEAKKTIVPESLVMVKDIPYNLTNTSNTTTGGFHTDNSYYVGKVVKEIGFEKATDGVMHIARIRKDGNSYSMVKEITVNFSGTGREWFPVDLGVEPFREDEWIAVVKGGATTAKFKYGAPGDGRGFRTAYSAGDNGVSFNQSSGASFGTSELGIGYKVLEPEKEISFMDELVDATNRAKSRFAGKKFAFTGDSITTLQGAITAGNAVFYNTERVPTFGISQVSDTWWGQLSDLAGAVMYKNDAWSGSRVSGETNAGLAHSRTKRIPAETDVLFTMIGINDMSGNVPLGDFDKQATTYDVSTITNAYCKMITDFQRNLPNTKIYVLTPLRAFISGRPRKNTNGLTVPDLATRIKEICHHFGVECIDTGELGWSQFNFSRVLPDGLHPNKQGATEIAEFIYNKIK